MSDPPVTSVTYSETQVDVSHRVAVLVWTFILSLAIGSLSLFYHLGVTDIYGDALAHMEGARRIFDSLTPGYAEIGTVWLPLYHLVVAPLAQNDFLWRTGLAGSLVSIVCFVLTAWVLFRLGCEMNSNLGAGVVALAGFVFCPNMLYLGSTPMTEPMALLWAVLTVYGLFRYQQNGRTQTLILASVAAFFGTLTRYDEWYVLPFAALFVLLARRERWSRRLWHVCLFSFIAGAGPVLWLLHNAYRFGNPLEFYNGTYSAKAIYAHQLATTGFRYPTGGNLRVSARYYLEDLKLVIGAWSLELAVVGFIAWVADRQERVRRSAAFLLLVPLPFYLQAMAHAAIPLYVPTLFPYTYYNLRYGLELLPAIALLPALVISSGLARPMRLVMASFFVMVLAVQMLGQVNDGLRNLPLVQESIQNTPCQEKLQRTVIEFFQQHYDGQRILMAAGKWPCVAPRVGIPYRKILTENNRRYWHEMRKNPQAWVEWIIRGDGDAVDDLMRAYPDAFRGFAPVERESSGKARTVMIYRRQGG